MIELPPFATAVLIMVLVFGGYTLLLWVLIGRSPIQRNDEP